MRHPTPDVLERARKVRIVLFDSDGVLTDGRIVVTADGADARCFDVKDGQGIHLGKQAGLLFGVISGRRSAALASRADELGLDEVHQGVQDKLGRVDEILTRRELGRAAACFVGDDLVDVPAMRACGLAVAPADAVPEARAAAQFVTDRNGGRGAVREVVDLLLQANGSWERVTSGYLGGGA